MEMMVKIPLNRLRSHESINKIEITHIDRLLTTDQKRKIAGFFRQEEAKRTKYDREPTWEVPYSVQAKRRASATGMTWDDFLKCWEKEPREEKTLTLPEKPITVENKVRVTSPGSPNPSETESEVLVVSIRKIIKKQHGTYADIRKSVVASQHYLKEFERISKTRFKRLLHKEKTLYEKEHKKENHQ